MGRAAPGTEHFGESAAQRGTRAAHRAAVFCVLTATRCPMGRSPPMDAPPQREGRIGHARGAFPARSTKASGSGMGSPGWDGASPRFSGGSPLRVGRRSRTWTCPRRSVRMRRQRGGGHSCSSRRGRACPKPRLQQCSVVNGQRRSAPSARSRTPGRSARRLVEPTYCLSLRSSSVSAAPQRSAETRSPDSARSHREAEAEARSLASPATALPAGQRAPRATRSAASPCRWRSVGQPSEHHSRSPEVGGRLP
jgi:hypothetical protein